MMNKIRPPRYKCDLGKSPIDPNLELGFYRDKIGNVTVFHWKRGEGFTDLSKPNIRELKKLRDWLTKLIEFVERP